MCFKKTRNLPFHSSDDDDGNIGESSVKISRSNCNVNGEKEQITREQKSVQKTDQETHEQTIAQKTDQETREAKSILAEIEAFFADGSFDDYDIAILRAEPDETTPLVPQKRRKKQRYCLLL